MQNQLHPVIADMQSDTIVRHVKCSLFLSGLKKNWQFHTIFSESHDIWFLVCPTI
jgi:hypothetical protein